jgi:hypothetical protein
MISIVSKSLLHLVFGSAEIRCIVLWTDVYMCQIVRCDAPVHPEQTPSKLDAAVTLVTVFTDSLFERMSTHRLS